MDVIIDAKGSDRPNLKDLQNQVVLKVADKWKEIGMELLDPKPHERTLEVIKADYPNSVAKCCQEMFRTWLDIKVDANWNQVILAVRRAGLASVAGHIEDMLEKATTITPISGKDDGEEVSNTPLNDSHELEIEFAKTTNKIKKVLSEEKVNVTSLVQNLQSFSVVKLKNIPLIAENKKIVSIEDLWKVLNPFWHIYDFDILDFVMGVVECDRAKKIYKSFQSKIDPSVLEEEDLLLHIKKYDREGQKPQLRVKVKAKTCTQKIKSEVKNMISKTFDIAKFSLAFRCIQKGCIELTFIAPNPSVISHVEGRQVTGQDIVNLAAFNIMKLQTASKELRVEPTQIGSMDEVVLWTPIFIDPRLQMLQSCPNISLGGADTPSMRACPSCGALLQHIETGNKYMTCPACSHEFCFICLKPSTQCTTDDTCAPAPRQTNIPG